MSPLSLRGATVPGFDQAIRFRPTFGGAAVTLLADPHDAGRVKDLIVPEPTGALSHLPDKYPRRIPLAKKWIAQCLATRGDCTGNIARTLRATDVTMRKLIKSGH